MNNKELLEIKRKAKKIFNEIDKIGLPHEKFLGKVWDTSRYAHCYVTMNYAISQEVTKLNESNNKICEAFKELSDLLDAVKPLDEERGQE